MIVIFCPDALFGQDQENIATPAVTHGFQVRNVSANIDYYSTGLSSTAIGQYAAKFQPDAAAGASAQVGWLRASERTASSFSYTSSLAGRLRYSELNAWNHAFSLTTSHHFSPRTIGNFSIGGDLSNLEQSLFSATTLGNIASARTGFDALADAMLAAKFNSPLLSSIFNSASLAESPLRNLLYGQRMFTTGVKSSVSYAYSPRLSISFQGGAGRNQYLSDAQVRNSGMNYLLANTTSGSGDLSLSYSLSPLTQIGGSLGTQRIVSSVQDSYTTTALFTMGRTLARRWILQIRGGAGVINPVGRRTLLIGGRPWMLSTSAHPAGGASLGYKTTSHTILASVEQTVSDSYGLGAATTTTAGASWNWRRPGHDWWLESGTGWQQLEGTGLGRISGLRTTLGLGRKLRPQLAILAQYAYLDYSGRVQAIAYSQGQSAVRVSLSWTPHPEMPR
jgi:hypothetical protein